MEQALYYADTPTADAQDLSAYYSQLYELYATDVLRMCYFYLADKQKAEDVVQDVFVRLMTTNPSLQAGKEKAWLLKVAMNRCRDLWRGAWLKRVVLGSPTFELIPAPDEFTQIGDRQEMMNAINKLPTMFKEVILLHYYQGYGISDISEMMDLPEVTISSRLSRARKKLEEVLMKGGEEPCSRTNTWTLTLCCVISLQRLTRPLKALRLPRSSKRALIAPSTNKRLVRCASPCLNGPLRCAAQRWFW